MGGGFRWLSCAYARPLRKLQVKGGKARFLSGGSPRGPMDMGLRINYGPSVGS